MCLGAGAWPGLGGGEQGDDPCSPGSPLSQVFQCLLIEGENSGEDALREAQRFVISDDEFEEFLERHKGVSCLVPESNQKVVCSPVRSSLSSG